MVHRQEVWTTKREISITYIRSTLRKALGRAVLFCAVGGRARGGLHRVRIKVRTWRPAPGAIPATSSGKDF